MTAQSLIRVAQSHILKTNLKSFKGIKGQFQKMKK